MPAVVLATSGATNWGPGQKIQDRSQTPLSLDGQERVTFTALELKRNPKIKIRRIVCSESCSAYQTSIVMAVILDIPMAEIFRDERLREGWKGEDNLVVVTRHLSCLMDHGRGLLDRDKISLLLVGHPSSLDSMLGHFRQKPIMDHGVHKLLHF